MHSAGAYISRLLPPGAVAPGAAKSVVKGAVLSLTLTPVSAAALKQALLEDAQDYFYSACLSMVDAVRGLLAGFCTWSTVKCYYSAFYALRAHLALDGVCAFYVNTSPFSVVAASGASCTAGEKSTHGFIISLFSKHNPGHRFVSQLIALADPLVWLTARREDSNYNFPRFGEPDVPDHFRRITQIGIRRSIHAYLTDKSDLYTFDPDHAMLAYPLAIIADVGQRLKLAAATGVGFEADELRFLMESCRDRHGALSFAKTLEAIAGA